MQEIKALITGWEVLAESYSDKASKQTNQYTAERLYAQSDMLKVCADQLSRITKSQQAGEQQTSLDKS